MEFKEPPPLKKQGSKEHWINTVQELKTNPNQWGLVGTYSVGVSTHIKNGRYPAFFPAGEDNPVEYIKKHWQVTTRSSATEPNRVDVFVRWLG